MSIPRRLFWSFWFGMAIAAIGGCGPDQHGLIMRAAQRPRPSESDSPVVADTTPSTEAAAEPAGIHSRIAGRRMAAAQTAGVPRSRAEVAESPIAAPPSESVAGNSAGASEPSRPTETSPIDERRGAVPLGELERCQRAAENLRRIGAALAAYVERNGCLPLPAMKTASGVATLSWRVELLPYLGYEDLYRRFDSTQPWDSPKNLPLLDFIPDCYVSPERFDTSTNYLGVAGKNYLFNGDPVPLRKVEDGLENTIAIVEVDDSQAVPWTRPADYSPAEGNRMAGLGSQRPEGIYALWGNGWATLLAAGVSDQQLHRAFTYESGDGLVAGDIHNALVVQAGPPTDSAARVPAGMSTGSGLAAVGRSAPEIGSGSHGAASADGRDNSSRGGERPRDASQTRTAVPSRSELAVANQQVRDLYEERLKAAADFAHRRAIAQEMLDAAAEMRSDPAGAYALQNAAVRIAAASGDLETAGRAVDWQVAMFEVDAMQRNGAMLALLGRSGAAATAAWGSGRAYLRRALPVCENAIESDDYERADSLCQFAIQCENRTRDRTFLADLNRLRQQISAARSQHRRVEAKIAELREYPSDAPAKTVVGRYLAFIKGDWQGGLALLAEGDDIRLARIAAADLTTDASGNTMMSTADAWWELGDAAGSKAFRGACRRRAAHWYARAIEVTPESLSRMHAQGRLHQAEADAVRSPLDAIARLADNLGIDLEEDRANLEQPIP